MKEIKSIDFERNLLKNLAKISSSLAGIYEEIKKYNDYNIPQEQTQGIIESVVSPLSQLHQEILRNTTQIRVPNQAKVRQDAEMKLLQARVNKLQEENTKLKVNKKPKYHKESKTLMFETEFIDNFIKHSRETEILEILFEKIESMQKEWSWDEIIEKLGEEPKKTDWNKIYHAGKRINDKVGKKTLVNDLLIVTTKTIQVNPKYLS